MASSSEGSTATRAAEFPHPAAHAASQPEPRRAATMCPVIVLFYLPFMTEPHGHHTVAREDLLFTVEMVPRSAEHLWPRRRRPGDHDRLRPVASAVVDHLELCGLRCVRKAPGVTSSSSSRPVLAASRSRGPRRGAAHPTPPQPLTIVQSPSGTRDPRPSPGTCTPGPRSGA